MKDKRDDLASQIEELVSFANKLADTSRMQILKAMNKGFRISVKTDKSFVTEVDVNTESLLRKVISDRYPDHSIVGEEFSNATINSPFVWYLDPIDGTEEFVNGIPTFGTIIGLHYFGLPVVGIIDHPALNIRSIGAYSRGTYCNNSQIKLDNIDIKSSIRLGISKRTNFLRQGNEGILFDKITSSFPNIRIFDTCFAYTCAANGSLDAMLDYNVRSWDIAASQILIEEAGGKFLTIKKSAEEPSLAIVSVVFGKNEIVKQISESLTEN
jgi:fructose-1,6-bisphosphatase/inositol monophosphatase family enzyme